MLQDILLSYCYFEFDVILPYGILIGKIISHTNGVTMETQKLSISLPRALYEFIGQYQTQYHCQSRSEVITQALYMLQQAHLGECYRQANQEIDNAFEGTAGDGLEEDETW